MFETSVFVRVLAATALALVVGASCKPKFAPEEPTGVIAEACCKVVSKDLKTGAGCRATGKCSDDEKIWMRGAVTCSPVEVDRCMGGRCCSYRQMYGSDDALYNWDPEGGESGAETTPEDEPVTPEGSPASEAPTEPEPEAEPQPEPEAEPALDAAPPPSPAPGN